MPSAVESSALLSPCRRYRYALRRVWDPSLPRVGFVMLNPSTADASADDPTVRRCMGLARRWGAGGIDVCNLFALRATDPRELRRAEEPVGPDADRALRELAEASDVSQIVAAWGEAAALPGEMLRRRELLVAELLPGRSLLCLGQTQAGRPRHPLYVRNDVAPQPFAVRPAEPSADGRQPARSLP